MTASAAFWVDTTCAARDWIFASVFTPEVSSGLSSIAASINERLPWLIPVIPIALNDATVSVTAGVAPEEVAMIAATMSANAEISACVSTALNVARSISSFIKSILALVSITAKPRLAKSLDVSKAPLLRSPSAPTITFCIALTIGWISMVVSESPALTIASTEFTAWMFIAVTPVTSAFAKSARVGSTLVPSYALIALSPAASASAAAAVVIAWSSASVLNPDAPANAYASRTNARFDAVTPLMPNAASNSGVSAGTATPPFAVVMIPATVVPSAYNSG